VLGVGHDPNPDDAARARKLQIADVLERTDVEVEDWSKERFIVEPEDAIGHLLLATR
jgi:hypothetical protein